VCTVGRFGERDGPNVVDGLREGWSYTDTSTGKEGGEGVTKLTGTRWWPMGGVVV